MCCTATGTVENVSHCIKIQETEISKAASDGRDGLFCAQAGKQPHVQQRDIEQYGWQLTAAALRSITVAWLCESEGRFSIASAYLLAPKETDLLPNHCARGTNVNLLLLNLLPGLN